VRCVWEGVRQGRAACAYIAQVRIRVRAGETLVYRDGHGSGIGSGAGPGEAHETALKEAETDATKRALVTFGNPFGLCLYDREQKQVRRARRKPARPIEWLLRSASGEVTERFDDPARFCSALRRALEAAATPAELTQLWSQHDAGLAALGQVPQLTNERGAHFSEILAGLYRRRLAELQQRAPTGSPQGQESVVPSPLRPRRVRNKAHLRRVAQQPCLICGRLPAHAHHLKFLEPRGLGLKPSDAFAVPLCRLHHRALHDQGDEQSWWQQHKLDPVLEAQRLWKGDGTPSDPPY
jgi:hypothetical protein